MLRWESDTPPLPQPVVTAAEMILGRVLPRSYKALVQAHPGGRPVAERDAEDGEGMEGWLACVGWLMSLDPRHPENVFETISHLDVDEQFPEDLVPIIGDGGGNLICLDYRASAGDPAVVYWQHDLDGDEALVAICASFDAFLEILGHEDSRYRAHREGP